MADRNDLSQNFYALNPREVMNAVEQAGFHPTGEYVQLNSYENRVFDVYLEAELSPAELGNHLIVKFYRPYRWNQDAILEEHDFLRELKEAGIPAVSPLVQKNGLTLSEHKGMHMAVFPKAMGRLPQELSTSQLRQIGRTLAHLHNVGAQKAAQHRLSLTPLDGGEDALEHIRGFIAPEVESRYTQAAHKIIEWLDEKLNPDHFIRIHGDCHKGNLLMTDQAGEDKEFFFIDFDDFVNGPPVQDFWMLMSSTADQSEEEKNALLDGYEELREFDHNEWAWTPALRGYRILRYSGWIAERWADPTFPQLFPQFRDFNYWAEETEILESLAWSL